MAGILKNKWLWIGLGVILLVFVIAVIVAKSGSKSASGDTSNGNTATNPSANPQPGQILKTFNCETKKVCEGRTGFANWVKTGTQKKCNASNLSQGLCISDCLGTCSAWQ